MGSKFVFNLAPLKRLRSHRLGVAKREYLKLQASLFNLQEQIESLKLQRRQTLGDIASHLTEQSGVNGMSFLLSTISVKIKLLEDKIASLTPDVERHRRWMVEASRELRAIEILEEKRKAEFLIEEEKKEKRRIDQWASESFARKMALDQFSEEMADS